MSETEIFPLEPIQSHILMLRGVRVMPDADLARLYGVATKRLNEQVGCNARKFPEDFCLELNAEEVATSSGGHGGRRYAPYAFTEHGAIQAANILNSAAATEMSVHVVRAFVRLRQIVVNHKAIAASSPNSTPVSARTMSNSLPSSLRSASSRLPMGRAIGARSVSMPGINDRFYSPCDLGQ